MPQTNEGRFGKENHLAGFFTDFRQKLWPFRDALFLKGYWFKVIFICFINHEMRVLLFRFTLICGRIYCVCLILSIQQIEFAAVQKVPLSSIKINVSGRAMPRKWEIAPKTVQSSGRLFAIVCDGVLWFVL